MDNCADCTKRDRRSLTKLYNQANVQGTRVCGINYCLFGGKTLYTVSLLYIQRFAEMIAVFYCIVAKKTGEQFRSPVFKINLVLQFLQPVLHVHPDAVLRLDGTYPMF